jgi:hypothetical protein
VSLETGWVLGGAPCGSTSCVALLRTSNAGHTWSAEQAPPTTFAPAPYSFYLSKGVSQVRFADPQDGWAYGPELWSTHDGGLHWNQIDLGSVWSLEASDGDVHAVILQQTTNTLVMESSPANRDAWTTTGSLHSGAGPVPSADLVLQGQSGWVVVNDRTVVDGDRLTAGRWASWIPACTGTGGFAALSASSGSSLVALCQQGIWGGLQPPAVRAYFSNNGGQTFYGGSAPLPGDVNQTGNAVASPAPGVIVTDTYVNKQYELIETFNHAGSWVPVATVSGQATYLGFTSSSQGVAITSNGKNVMLMTFDGGRHWAPVTF